MAIKTFTTGEVLTASDTNTYLANSGLVYIKSQTITGTPTTVTIFNAFSADYENYKIIINSNVSSSGNSMFVKLNGSTGSTYNYNGNFMSYANATINGAIGPTQNEGLWLGISGPNFNASFDILRPNLANPTILLGQSAESVYASTMRGYDSNAASSTDISFIQAGGPTFTAGIITVYGYRKA